MSHHPFLHPVMAAALEASRVRSLGPGPLEVDYSAAVAEEVRSHTDVIDVTELEIAPVIDTTLREGRYDRSERDQLAEEFGVSSLFRERLR